MWCFFFITMQGNLILALMWLPSVKAVDPPSLSPHYDEQKKDICMNFDDVYVYTIKDTRSANIYNDYTCD